MSEEELRRRGIIKDTNIVSNYSSLDSKHRYLLHTCLFVMKHQSIQVREGMGRESSSQDKGQSDELDSPMESLREYPRLRKESEWSSSLVCLHWLRIERPPSGGGEAMRNIEK